jgi:hypothetical protein
MLFRIFTFVVLWFVAAGLGDEDEDDDDDEPGDANDTGTAVPLLSAMDELARELLLLRLLLLFRGKSYTDESLDRVGES